MRAFILAGLFALCGGIVAPPNVEAGFIFHATKRAVAQRLVKQGFNKALMKPNARFGAKAYASGQPKLALKERPGADAIVKYRTSGSFYKNALDTRRLSSTKIKEVAKVNDLRGQVKKGVIGSKLGQRLGRQAEKSNRVIIYRSAKDRSGTNYAVPSGIYNTKAMNPVGIIKR